MNKMYGFGAAMRIIALLMVLTFSGLYSSFLLAHEDHHHAVSNDNNVVSVDVTYVDGVVHQLLATQQANSQTIRYQTSHDEAKTWSEPVSVITAENAFKFKRGNDARIAVQGDAIVAVWMTRVEGAPHNAGPMMAMRSEDKGKTWQSTTMPADWKGPHGFFAMAGGADAINLVWLDSRQKVEKGAQGLRFAQSIDGGKTWSKNKTLDAQTCACCWNTVRFNNDNFYVLYRDKQPSDMALGKINTQGQWQRLSTVGDFAWEFEGCPHVGGGLAFDNEMNLVHATVTTGKEGREGLYYTWSNDDGLTWAKPMRLGDDTAFHSSLAVTQQGEVIAVWDRATENGLQLMMSSSQDNGISWQPEKALSRKESSASHPIVTPLENGVLLTWTETDQHDVTHLKNTVLLP